LIWEIVSETEIKEQLYNTYLSLFIEAMQDLQVGLLNQHVVNLSPVSLLILVELLLKHLLFRVVVTLFEVVNFRVELLLVPFPRLLRLNLFFILKVARVIPVVSGNWGRRKCTEITSFFLLFVISVGN